MAGNPFTPRLKEPAPAETDELRFSLFGIVYGAEALWSLLGDMPNKAEATLAQRKLEETVFWAGRAAGVDL